MAYGAACFARVAGIAGIAALGALRGLLLLCMLVQDALGCFVVLRDALGVP